MRRSSLIAVVAVLAIGLAGGGVASAHKGGSEPGHHQGQRNHVMSFRAHASPSAEQGGTLKVVAKVRHAPKTAVVTAKATVNFASAPVTVDLVLCGRGHTHLKVAGKGHGAGGHHHRHGNVFKVRVPVLETEALGPVTIDVVFTVDGVEQAPIQVTTEIVAPEAPPAP